MAGRAHLLLFPPLQLETFLQWDGRALAQLRQGCSLAVSHGYIVNPGSPIPQAGVGGTDASGGLQPPWNHRCQSLEGVLGGFEASPGLWAVSLGCGWCRLNSVSVYFCFLQSFIIKLSLVDIR